MVTLEQVEKLRQYGNITYDEAKKALEEAKGDILEAIIILEKQKLIEEPENGGYHNSMNEQESGKNHFQEKEGKAESNEKTGASFSELVGRFLRWSGGIINKGNRNHFEVIKGENKVITIPVTVLVLLLMFTFWITVPLIVVGLFFDYKYMFIGPELGKENVNRAMDSVADAAENLKKEMKGEKPNGEDSHN
ncbi:MAG TPA: DUF4342 domain-containing protein [Epulopiscium sp.]|nr:DUF4342 domain-containing protein [Candidatus Epulonipiscium sp.]